MRGTPLWYELLASLFINSEQYHNTNYRHAILPIVQPDKIATTLQSQLPENIGVATANITSPSPAKI